MRCAHDNELKKREIDEQSVCLIAEIRDSDLKCMDPTQRRAILKAGDKTSVQQFQDSYCYRISPIQYSRLTDRRLEGAH